MSTFPMTDAYLRALAELPPSRRVIAGAVWKDWTDPGWEHRLNTAPGEFDLNDDSRCVEGQACGTFGNSPLFADLRTGDRWDWWTSRRALLRATALGLVIAPEPGEEDDPDHPGDQPALEDCWREQQLLRLSRAAAVAVAR